MEPGALLFVTFVAIGGFGLLWFRIQEVRGKAPLWPDLWSDHSVKQEQFPAPESNTVPTQSDAVDRPIDRPEPNGSEPPATSSEPIKAGEWVYITKDDLIRSLALVILTDDNNRQLSQEIISRAAGVSKENTAAIIHEMRGTQPTSASPVRPFPELTSQGRKVSSSLRTKA